MARREGGRRPVMEAMALDIPRTSMPGPENAAISRLLELNVAAYQLAVHVLGSPQGAEDVVQQAYLRALSEVGAGTEPREERTWFLRIVANAAKDWRKMETRRKRREAAVRQATSSEDSSRQEMVVALRRELWALDEKYRLPIALCYEQKLSQREAATILDIPQQTLSDRVAEGIRQLRRALGQTGYAGATATVLSGLSHTAPPVPASLAAAVEKLLAGGAVAKGAETEAAKVSAALKGGLLVKIGLGLAAVGLVAGEILWAIGGPSSPSDLPSPAEAGSANAGVAGGLRRAGGSGEPPKSPAAAPAPAVDPDNQPIVIPDESAQDWVVDRFAGNSTTGPIFYQGPAREVGGMGGAGVTELPDGTIYVGCSSGITEFSPDGVLRLFMSADGPIEGPLEQCQAGQLIWNAREKALYLTGPRCIRKVVEKPNGAKWVEVFAGIPTEEPGKDGPRNGPVKTATFPLSHRGIVCNSRGVFYVLANWHGLRKIENGEVVNVGLKFIDGPKGFDLSLSGNLALGEDDDTLYVADHWNWVARRIDLKTGEVRNVAFMARKGGTMPNVRRERLGQNADGPALTHASHNSGLGGVSYDRFHKALWVNGDDETRFRWLKDGWVKSVIGCDNKARGSASTGRWSFEEMGTPGPKASIAWCSVRGFDSKGGVYIGGGGLPHGVWRAYNKKEGSSHESWSKKEDRP